MADYLNQKDENSQEGFISDSSERKEIITFDHVSETLLHIHSRSKFKTYLAKALGNIYPHKILFILFSILIGVIFILTPYILELMSFLSNIGNVFLVFTLSACLIAFILILIRLIDDKIYKLSLIAKWERNNTLSNFGTFCKLLILMFSVVNFCRFLKRMTKLKHLVYLDYKNEEKSSTIIEEDFIFKIAFYLTLVHFDDEIDYKIYEENCANFIINDYESIRNDIRYYLEWISIFIAIVSFFKILKCIFIVIKYNIENFLFYFTLFLLSTLMVVLKKIDLNIIDKNYKIFSIIEFMLLMLLMTSYLVLVIHKAIKHLIRPKDKSFSIRNYRICEIIIIRIFDLLIILSLIFGFRGLIKLFINLGKEKVKDIYSLIISFKILYSFVLFGNIYNYGHHILSSIFKPISSEFAPAELINPFYIKAKRNLYFHIDEKKNTKKRMKDVITRPK